jgi:ferredoxin
MVVVIRNDGNIGVVDVGVAGSSLLQQSRSAKASELSCSGDSTCVAAVCKFQSLAQLNTSEASHMKVSK